MTNSQEIIFSILGILWLILYFKIGYSLNDKKDTFMLYALYTIITGLFIMIAFFSTLRINELEEKTKGKCPELEKVENVYRIKNG